MKNRFCQNIFQRPWILVGLLTLIGFLVRIYHLGQIKSLIFDEVYFVNFAKDYLHGVTFFDIHPPLGKLIIASGIKVFGDSPFGWRMMSVVFGTLLIPLMYLAGKELGGKLAGIFAAAVITFDGMLTVYSRLGLMDIFLSFFIVASFLALLKFTKNLKFYNLVLAGALMGLAASVKYNGFSLFFIFILVGLIKKIPFKKFIYDYFLALILLPGAIYLSFFLFNFHGRDFFQQVYQWHLQSLGYNFHLTATHPYGSKWWTWFLMLRPIWLYFQSVNGKYVGVVGMGNPLSWWSALIIVPLMIYDGIRNKDKTSLVILAAFLIFWLPWALVKRVLFIYHAIPSFLFLSLGIAYYLDKLTKIEGGQWLVGLYFSILIILYVYFLPIWIGWPISSPAFYHRIWLKGWI